MATPRRSRRRGMPWWGMLTFLGICVLLAAVITGGVLCALGARSAYAEMREAEPLVGQLREQALAGNREEVDRLAAELREHTTTAREAMIGPHWTVAGWLPGVGTDVRAVQRLAFVTDDLAQDALGDLVEAVWAVDPANMAPESGRIDLAPIAEVGPQVVSADAAVQEAAAELAALDTEELIGPVATAVDRLSTQVDEIAGLTGTAARAVQLLPSMLGADGPREYLLLAQNNAEPRATGGMPGAMILLRAEDGAIGLVEQRAAADFDSAEDPVLELGEDETALYTERLGQYVHHVNRTPDFPRAAELAAAMWERGTGEEIDGVLAIDPAALGALLEPSGPVTLPTGQQVSGEDVPRLLLNQVYIDIPDPAMQDLFFEAVAGVVFDRVLAGADPAATVGVLDEVAEQGRLMVWSAHEEEQELLTGTNLSGELRGHYEDRPILGVYVNDLTAAKIGYYQHMDVAVEAVECRPDGSRDVRVTVTMRSEVPPEHPYLPDYLIGNGQLVERGHIRSQVVLYAPTGAQITNFASETVPEAVYREHEGLETASVETVLAPGESGQLSYRIDLPAELAGEPLVRLTPGARQEQHSASVSPCG